MVKQLLHEDDYLYARDECQVVVCTPSAGLVQATFAYDLGYLMRESGSAFVLSMGSVLPALRHGLTQYAVESGATHLLFIDSDMRFPSNTIVRLLSRRKDFVGANCRVRNTTVPEAWTAWKAEGDERISSVGKTGIEEVTTLGFGVTLLSTAMLQKIEEPRYGLPWDGTKYVGEDIFFCHKVREAGFSVWIDHDLSQEVRHTGSIEMGVVDV